MCAYYNHLATYAILLFCNLQLLPRSMLTCYQSELCTCMEGLPPEVPCLFLFSTDKGAN